jgi:autophagy-related protein 9
MASNILSRLLPSTSDHAAPPTDDIERHAGTDNPDLERLLAEGLEDDMMAGDDMDDVPPELLEPANPVVPKNAGVPNNTGVPDDDDVPASLLLEGDRRRRRKSKGSRNEPPIPAPGPQTRNTRAQWQATQAQQRLHDDPASAPVPPTVSRRAGAVARPLDARERALWMWTNMDNIDEFLSRVYIYYEKHGIWSMLLERAIRLVTALFSYFLLTFVFFCIDYSKIPGRHRLDEVKIPHCTNNLPFVWNVVSWGIIFGVVFNAFRILQDAPLLWDMHNFYLHMLDIPDRDIQTVSWQYVVSKIMELRDSNANTATNISAANRRYLRTQSKQRMDAHDIANRLMRRENYWIAMINKDIMDCSLNIPFLGKRMFYNSSIEWNISRCVMDFVFDDKGQVRPEFKSIQRRRELVEVLRKRFWTLGLLNIFMSVPLAATEICLRFLRSFTVRYSFILKQADLFRNTRRTPRA